ncbi:MAG: SGNH/GDSL hydrolase family protein [Candidatus Izemoplasmatales bacterium]|jgi:hypothetical protein|nr:SGNH/GDSL hydrolase family protein [Candidatus Izemoplasmatales bacterium]
MKKLFALLVIILLLFVSYSCFGSVDNATTTLLTDSTIISPPTNVNVTESILTYSEVTLADSYEIEVTDQSNNSQVSYKVSNSTDLAFLLLNGNYTLRMKSLSISGVDSEYSNSVSFTILNSKKTSEIEGITLKNQEYVRFLGRTYYDESISATTIYSTASGFEVGFYGTSLEATFLATNTSSISKQPYFIVFLDGETDPTKGNTFILYASEVSYTLVSGLGEGYHHIRIVKRSEATDSVFSLKSISTDGSFAALPTEKTLKIQFIGASTMMGYGNLAAKPSESKSTENSNGMFAYPYLTSYMLDSEISILGASGWGISRGYNTGGVIDAVKNIPNAFDYVGIDNNAEVLTALPKWNQSSFVPNIIVVNLGSNDFNSSGYDSMSSVNQTAFVEQFVINYVDFLTKLHTYFPDAIIICAYGILSDNTAIENATLEVVSEANTAFSSVYGFKMTTGSVLDFSFGSDYHPSIQTHLVAANDLVNFILEITSYERIHEQITLN